MSGSRRILIVAGEASGDRHAAGLMREARTLDPSLSFIGIGGAEMRAAGLEGIFDGESIAVVGFAEVLTHLPRLRCAFNACRRVLREGVEAVVLVDYPGFNLRLARHASAAGVPVLYFICPQVWAWKPGRIEGIARDVDRMLVVLPFEADLFRGRGIEVEYVGHPLVDAVRPGAPPEETARRIGIDRSRPVLGILPGSRRSEIARNLPPALGAARLLRRSFPGLQVLVPAAPSVGAAVIERGLGSFADVGAIVTPEPFYDVLSICHVAIVASGTATLETALIGVPMVVIYRLNPVTAAVARRVTTVRTFGLVNIIAGERIVPECIQEECTPDRIAAAIDIYLRDPSRRAATVEALGRVRERLGEGGAYGRAAASLIEFLARRRPAR